jgi:hypothetical protein
MVRLHLKDGRVYKLKLRARYAEVRSESALRKLVESGIASHEKFHPSYGAALRSKWSNGQELDVLSLFGLVTRKERVDKEIK